MSYIVQYFRREKMVGESSWSLDIPPSCRQIRCNFAVHDADKAIILDDNGFELIIEERQKFDA
jgi:hypothetical protein